MLTPNNLWLESNKRNNLELDMLRAQDRLEIIIARNLWFRNAKRMNPPSPANTQCKLKQNRLEQHWSFSALFSKRSIVRRSRFMIASYRHFQIAIMPWCWLDSFLFFLFLIECSIVKTREEPFMTRLVQRCWETWNSRCVGAWKKHGLKFFGTSCSVAIAWRQVLRSTHYQTCKFCVPNPGWPRCYSIGRTSTVLSWCLMVDTWWVHEPDPLLEPWAMSHGVLIKHRASSIEYPALKSVTMKPCGTLWLLKHFKTIHQVPTDIWKSISAQFVVEPDGYLGSAT